MNGAEIFIKTAIAAGIEVCFANPGTTEMPLVEALDSVPGIRGILGLFEGVCSGAADGYARMKDKPAMTLLHLGPGLGNAIANLHNARRAHTPLLNVIGDHAVRHRPADALLTMDIEALARTVSGWQRNVYSPETISQDTADAVAAALRGQISTLIIPQDRMWAKCRDEVIRTPYFSFDPVDSDSIEAAARLLRGHSKTGIVLGKQGLRERGLKAADRIRAATGCDLLSETFPAYMDQGGGLPLVKRIPYFPDQAIAMLAEYEAFVFAGAREPVAFFGYEGMPSYFLSENHKRTHIGTGNQNVAEALEGLADALGVSAAIKAPRENRSEPDLRELPRGRLTREKICHVLTALQPENAIIVDEAITTGFGCYPPASSRAPYTLLCLTGGAIGQGMPSALGAAVACPDRPVINYQADGSAMYTLQALWTQAREGANVTTLICCNHSYNILKVELARAGKTSPGPNTLSMTDLDRPPLNWVQIGLGLGVPAIAVIDAEGLAQELKRALTEPGPHLIEMVL